MALGVSDSPEKALDSLDRAGLVARREAALASLRALRRRLDAQSQARLLNAYLHVTWVCDLRCSHCYAHAAPGRSGTMPVGDVARLVRELAAAGFRKVVVTGGEPLAHPQAERLVDGLAALRGEVKPLRTVLRTNLAGALTPERVDALLRSVDQIVVSVDGDEVSHDARRGVGAYARTVANLRTVLRRAAELRSASAAPPADIAIAAVLDADQMEGREGRAVRALGGELHLSVRLKPLLPLGRAADERPRLGFPGFDGGGDGSLAPAAESLACGARVAATCGLGMNLSIDPAGECFPCYALEGDEHRLGKVLSAGVSTLCWRATTPPGASASTPMRTVAPARCATSAAACAEPGGGRTTRRAAPPSAAPPYIVVPRACWRRRSRRFGHGPTAAVSGISGSVAVAADTRVRRVDCR